MTGDKQDDTADNCQSVTGLSRIKPAVSQAPNKLFNKNR